MYIIAGLGNPGKQYEGTRHNIGFALLHELADAYNINMDIANNKRIWIWQSTREYAVKE